MAKLHSGGIAIALLGATFLVAQTVPVDWKTVTALPGVEFKGLSPLLTRAAIRLMRNHPCTCGCDMKIAECRVKDPSCAYSRGVAAEIVTALKAGKDENAAIAAAKASRWGKGPQREKILEDAVPINIAGSPVKGPANAPITLVEFSDFQCPYCQEAVARLNQVLAAYPQQVRLVFKQFPLDTHAQAALAAAAALAAHKQGKFWQMHDAMFANRKDLSRPSLLALATKTGLDMKRFTADLDSLETRKVIARDIKDGDDAGVQGTPTVYLNGQKYNGSLAFEAFKPHIDAALKKSGK